MSKGNSNDKRRSDAEVFEEIRRITLAEMDRCLAMRAVGKTVEDYFESQRSRGFRQHQVPVRQEDIREIGCFRHDPSGLRQWVYRTRTGPDHIYLLSWTTRLRLQQAGAVLLSASAFMTD